MSALELVRLYVGKHYPYICGGLTIIVRVIDARYIYGRNQVCITPVRDGSGSIWVDVASLGAPIATPGV